MNEHKERRVVGQLVSEQFGHLYYDLEQRLQAGLPVTDILYQMDKLVGRQFCIRKIVEACLRPHHLIHLTPSRDYPDEDLVAFTEYLLMMLDRAVVGYNGPPVSTVGVYERHNKHREETIKHWHLIMPIPDGYEGRVTDDSLVGNIEHLIKRKKRNQTDETEKADETEEIIKSKIEDNYGRPVFAKVQIDEREPEWTNEHLANYMTKNLLHPEVLTADSQWGAGFYVRSGRKLERLSVPVGEVGLQAGSTKRYRQKKQSSQAERDKWYQDNHNLVRFRKLRERLRAEG